jgi:hypothetical protein
MEFDENGLTICPQCKRHYKPKLERPKGDRRCLQVVFPDSKRFEREQLLTGLCSDKCWKKYLKVKISRKEVKAIREAEHLELRKAADKFLKALTEAVNHYVLFHDVEGLDRLVTQVQVIQDHAVLEVLRNKGLQKEIDALCDKAGSAGSKDFMKFMKETT